jgi:uncharacterized protein
MLGMRLYNHPRCGRAGRVIPAENRLGAMSKRGRISLKFGLKETTIENFGAVFAGFPPVERAVLYGSRAKGDCRNGSDTDLTLRGKDLTLNVIYKIDQGIDDLLLPYTLDLSIFEQLTDPDLIDHIQRVGVVLCQRNGDAT